MPMKEGPFTSEDVRELTPDESRLRVVRSAESDVDQIAADQEARRSHVRAVVPLTTGDLLAARHAEMADTEARIPRTPLTDAVQRPQTPFEPFPAINNAA